MPVTTKMFLLQKNVRAVTVFMSSNVFQVRWNSVRLGGGGGGGGVPPFADIKAQCTEPIIINYF